MATIKLRKWDSAEHLKTDEDIVFLTLCNQRIRVLNETGLLL